MHVRQLVMAREEKGDIEGFVPDPRYFFFLPQLTDPSRSVQKEREKKKKESPFG